MLGDVPYSQPQANLLDGMIDRMNAAQLAFVVHVGDIVDSQGPCSDAWLEARKAQFGRFRHPFVLLPGDNEWVDCHRSGYEPKERLEKWRALFCVSVSLNEFHRQKGEYCENARWTQDNVVFVGLNVAGSNNNLARDPAEHAGRMRAVLAWLDEAAALARDRAGLVVLMHANPFYGRPSAIDGYVELRERLRALGRERPGKVLLAHGDTHWFKDDEPLPGVRRVEVFGSPYVRWTLVRVRKAPELAFEIDPDPQPR